MTRSPVGPNVRFYTFIDLAPGPPPDHCRIPGRGCRPWPQAEPETSYFPHGCSVLTLHRCGFRAALLDTFRDLRDAIGPDVLSGAVERWRFAPGSRTTSAGESWLRIFCGRHTGDVDEDFRLAISLHLRRRVARNRRTFSSTVLRCHRSAGDRCAPWPAMGLTYSSPPVAASAKFAEPFGPAR
jgi:hypothetical protein